MSSGRAAPALNIWTEIVPPASWEARAAWELAYSLSNAPVWQLLQLKSSFGASIWKNVWPVGLSFFRSSPLPCARMVWHELQSLAPNVRLPSDDLCLPS